MGYKHMGHLEPYEFCSLHKVKTSISTLGLFPPHLQPCSILTKCFVAWNLFSSLIVGIYFCHNLFKRVWEMVSHCSADFSPSCSLRSITPYSFPSFYESIWHCYERAQFFQVLTHLCLVLLHLVFISMNLPQQIFNSFVAELVPFAIAFIQLSHLSYQKRGHLGSREGRKQELKQIKQRWGWHLRT